MMSEPTPEFTWEDLPPQPWPLGTEAPPDQLAEWLLSMPREQLVWLLGRQHRVWTEDSMCKIQGHQGRIDYLEGELRRRVVASGDPRLRGQS